MSEYLHVEKPFLDQLAGLGWEVVDEGRESIPSNPMKSRRATFRQIVLPEVPSASVRAINLIDDGGLWFGLRVLRVVRGPGKPAETACIWSGTSSFRRSRVASPSPVA